MFMNNQAKQTKATLTENKLQEKLCYIYAVLLLTYTQEYELYCVVCIEMLFIMALWVGIFNKGDLLFFNKLELWKALYLLCLWLNVQNVDDVWSITGWINGSRLEFPLPPAQQKLSIHSQRTDNHKLAVFLKASALSV